MNHQINTPIPVAHNASATSYLISPKHRGNATHEVSVWSVSYDLELDCFSQCFQNQWHNTFNGWGFVPADAKGLQVIGYNLRSPELIIAKFVSNQNLWHGYPADIRHKPADKPIPEILLSWFAAGHITKALMVRIKQGQL